MPDLPLSELHQRMAELIKWSEEANLAVARGGASDEVARMSRLSLWLALVFAFDGFVQHAAKALGVENQLQAAKSAEPGQPDALLRLKLLHRECGLDVSLPGESALTVVRRHMLLRNRWAHNLGLVSATVPELATIASWAGPGQQAWVTEAGWSEFRCVVENLSRQVMQLESLDGVPQEEGR